MRNQNQLFEIADRQQGLFTAKQAEACGYARSNFHLKIASGEWALAAECGLSQSMQEAYLELQVFFQSHVLEI